MQLHWAAPTFSLSSPSACLMRRLQAERAVSTLPDCSPRGGYSSAQILEMTPPVWLCVHSNDRVAIGCLVHVGTVELVFDARLLNSSLA